MSGEPNESPVPDAAREPDLMRQMVVGGTAVNQLMQRALQSVPEINHYLSAYLSKAFGLEEGTPIAVVALIVASPSKAQPKSNIVMARSMPPKGVQ